MRSLLIGLLLCSVICSAPGASFEDPDSGSYASAQDQDTTGSYALSESRGIARAPVTSKRRASSLAEARRRPAGPAPSAKGKEPVASSAAPANPAVANVLESPRGVVAGVTSKRGPDVTVTVNSSAVLDRPSAVKRISVANVEIAEAVAVSSSEIVINGKSPGDTSLIIWDQGGSRLQFMVHVLPGTAKIDLVREELAKEISSDVALTAQDGLFFLTGTAKDVVTADRAFNIASTLGKVVNLLKVVTPVGEAQILLKVRFADVDRSASLQLGANLFGLDSQKGIGSSTTGQFGSAPTLNFATPPATATVTNLLNIFYYRPDINMGAVLQDLAARNLLQILAEPNLLTLSGKPASFLAGGEFPFPTLQGGGSGVGQITIQFKEFGIRLNFLPTVTPRGTIRMTVMPEVSALDYSNGLTVSGFTIPGLSTRRVQTEVELESGQSFVIAGLLNNNVTEQLSKMPGFANLPVIGKLFQSRSYTKNNSELLVMVTPELVKPIPAEASRPDVHTRVPFLKDSPSIAPQTPVSPDSHGVAAPWKRDSLAIEELKTSPLGVNSIPSAGSSPAAAPMTPTGPAPSLPASSPPAGMADPNQTNRTNGNN